MENNSLLTLDAKVKSNDLKRCKNNIAERNPSKDEEDKKLLAKKNLKKRNKHDKEQSKKEEVKKVKTTKSEIKGRKVNNISKK